MEVLTRRKAFLHTDFFDYGNGYDDGYGEGDGSGYGFCDSDGLGDSSIFRYGSGSSVGYGCGDGCGYGYSLDPIYGLKSLNGQLVDIIDSIPTILTSIIGNVAKGFIVRRDFSLAPTFVCKKDNIFAHGETLHKAWEALLEKLFDNMPTEERIATFCKEFKPGIKRLAMDFFLWHHRLTGSCEQGRKEFARQHSIDIDHDELTPEEFFALTRDSYGSSIIRQTEKAFACQGETKLMN